MRALNIVLCVILPPLAVLFSGKPFQAVLNIGLCLLGWIPGVLHAFAVVLISMGDKSKKAVAASVEQGVYNGIAKAMNVREIAYSPDMFPKSISASESSKYRPVRRTSDHKKKGRVRVYVFVGIFAAVLMAGALAQKDKSNEISPEVSPYELLAVKSRGNGLSELSSDQKIIICRSAIAKMMGRDRSIIAGKIVGDFVETSYIRPSDRTAWRNQCQFLGSKIVWRAYQEQGKYWGRWRDDPADSTITYRLEGNGLVINESYGGTGSDTSFSW